MSEYKNPRMVIGTVYNKKPGKETYGVQINLWEKGLSKDQLANKSVTLTNGQYLNVELIETQIERLTKAVESAETDEQAASKQKQLDRLLIAKEKNVFAELTLYRNE